MTSSPSSVDTTAPLIPRPRDLSLLSKKERVDERRRRGKVADVDPEADGGREDEEGEVGQEGRGRDGRCRVHDFYESWR
jgi:hypothetical protein